MGTLSAVSILVFAILSTNEGTLGGCIAEPCRKDKLVEVAGVPVWRMNDMDAYVFISTLAVSADGAPNAYHPDNLGLDHKANAGKPGRWWGLVTDNGRTDGVPLVQGSRDPFPGYYISATALFNPDRPRNNPGRYIDSRTVPYFVLPRGLSGDARLGDMGVVYNTQTQRITAAIFADIGPARAIGEGSIRLAENLGVDPNPITGGTSRPIVFMVFPGSGDGTPKSADEIRSIAQQRFGSWGGLPRLRACLTPDPPQN